MQLPTHRSGRARAGLRHTWVYDNTRMAEPLKNFFGPTIPTRIAGMIAAVHPRFGRDAFVADALAGYDELELMERGWKIAHALRAHLPADYERAVDILIASLDTKLAATENHGMAPFLYLPHVLFVAAYGLDHFEASMRAQYELTQRFTAEFSIRAYLEHHPKATLARLKEWARDPNPHVRRLVSEGTRPRLPWAPRLRSFQADPRPVLRLLEMLKDDPELYVRRSVANNLNDIGKDHPDVLVATAGKWLKGAGPDRLWLVRHALRSAIKRGDAGALALLGFGHTANLEFRSFVASPKRVPIGGSVVITFEAYNAGDEPQSVLVDLQVHFVKASGAAAPKVFKLKQLELGPGESVSLRKTVSIAELTTRKHYPGRHAVDALVNGAAVPIGEFAVAPARTSHTDSA